MKKTVERRCPDCPDGAECPMDIVVASYESGTKVDAKTMNHIKLAGPRDESWKNVYCFKGQPGPVNQRNGNIAGLTYLNFES